MAIRSMGTATLGFGLVAIPVKIYLACSAEGVSFNGLTRDGHRTRQKLVDEVTGEEVSRDGLVKGFEYTRGQYVTFDADELQALEAAGDKTVTIESCVPSTEVDLLQVEKSYYLGPDKGADRAYALLVETLSASGKVAIAQWTTRGRENLVLIRAKGGGLVMHTLFYSDEVRDQAEVTHGIPPCLASDRERAMAALLVQQMSTDKVDLSVYKDRYRERVQAAVDAKVAGREVVIPVAPASPQVLDMFEALKKSLGEAPKAPEVVPPAVEAPKPKKRGGKKAA